MKKIAVILGMAALGTALLTGCKPKTELPSKEIIVEIAKEAYVFGLPYVLEYRTMYRQVGDRSSPSYIGFGTFHHIGAVTPASQDVMTPNVDTRYSWVWLDLRAEPWVLTVPEMDPTGNRYYSIQCTDLAGFVVDNISALTDGYSGGHYLIAPPNWKGETPAGIKRVIKGETYLMATPARTELFNAKDDTLNVQKIQQGYQAQPLSRFLGQPAPTPAPEVDFYPFVDGKTDTDLTFYDCLSFVLQFNEPHPLDQPILERMASIGIAPGADFSKLVTEHNDLIEGATEGMKDMIDTMNILAQKPFDPVETVVFGNRSVIKDNYMDRAIGAYLGLFGNVREQAVYYNMAADKDTEPLDGSKHKYTITFAKDDIPQVQFFWSYTVYSMANRYLVPNPIERYAIGSRTDGLKYEPDGSLILYLQHESPGQDKESNWLPAPDEQFYTILRCYGPEGKVLDGSYRVPDIAKTN